LHIIILRLLPAQVFYKAGQRVPIGLKIPAHGVQTGIGEAARDPQVGFSAYLPAYSAGSHIYLYDLAGEALTQVTRDYSSRYPAWLSANTLVVNAEAPNSRS